MGVMVCSSLFCMVCEAWDGLSVSVCWVFDAADRWFLRRVMVFAKKMIGPSVAAGKHGWPTSFEVDILGLWVEFVWQEQGHGCTLTRAKTL
jgi:hypothetical protein